MNDIGKEGGQYSKIRIRCGGISIVLSGAGIPVSIHYKRDHKQCICAQDHP